ncbi:MAG TPA: HAMP domain-containing sensor histidine kinase [Planctomycetota bacterium]|nr:HAMP domain-containing sensor histidine kinase [Planctomycetota bacterium]
MLRSLPGAHPMYWLRRIPAETRIVVLVVFLALFQAVLLSVFGLGAIRRERRNAEEALFDQAQAFLQRDVVVPAQNALHERAGAALRVAFVQHGPDWRTRLATAGEGLFTDAFLVRGDGRIEEPGGLPLWLPEGQAARADEDAGSGARKLVELVRGHGFEEAQKAERNLRFAEQYPLALDNLGRSRALLHASAALLAPTTPEILLRVRRVGVLNRVAGRVGAEEIGLLLAQVDAAASGDPAYVAGCAAQDEQARVLGELRKEWPHFPASGAPVLHHNVRADAGTVFYVWQLGGVGDAEVLAVDPQALARFLAGIAAAAAAWAPEGVRPEIVVDVPPGRPAVKIPALPGYHAAAAISDAAVLGRARDRERPYWYIILFSVAGILAGGLLTARAVMREVKLAKLKSGFVSNVSHALKTPLTSLKMFSDMLRSGQVQDEAERRECLDIIAQETERLGRLIQQVLDFGRLEARRRPFHWVTGPLEPVVRAETERFRRATGLSADAFVVRIAVNTPTVAHDPDAFAEVVSNLLSNAFKYSRREDRHIELTLGPERRHVVLAVEDNGPGVQQRERKRIFEQFYRADDLLTREVEGTGLGLAIARHIVRAHGGRIFVEGRPEGGSRFVVTLPPAPGSRAAAAGASMENGR